MVSTETITKKELLEHAVTLTAGASQTPHRTVEEINGYIQHNYKAVEKACVELGIYVEGSTLETNRPEIKASCGTCLYKREGEFSRQCKWCKGNSMWEGK